jgi:hypothetical protein
VPSSLLLLGGVASWGWYQEELLRYMPLGDGSTRRGERRYDFISGGTRLQTWQYNADATRF